MTFSSSRTTLFAATGSMAMASLLLASPEDLVERGNALMQLSRDEMNPKYYKQAADLYSEALEIDPENSDAILGIAWVENSNHNFENGEAWAHKAIEINSELADAYSLLGDSQVEHGEYEEAFDNYQRSLDLRPDLASYSRAAHLVWLTGNRERGMKLMELAISAGAPHAENTAWCQSKLSIMLLHAGELKHALRLGTEAAAHAPKNPLVLANLGIIKRRLGETETALSLFERSHQLQPTHESLSHLYDLYTEQENTDKAQKIYEALVSYHRHHHGPIFGLEHPKDGHGHGSHGHHHAPASAQLAKFWLDRGLYPELALREAKNAFHQYPNIESAHTLALAYHKFGQNKNAARVMEKALHWTPPLPEIYYHAGLIQKGLGDDSEAQRNFERAVELDPQFNRPEIPEQEAHLASSSGTTVAALH
ncbi:tetratricopeptide repeat protein [Pelagicoccus sp. NFK12]|uniref:Tetratricopeptide repeat protein n=1 Tax=Pelagicoccus enzymogenes TaxID=2773457 RepID=A0A927F9B8_9BACT|nr:tetratricopeptide repeat protein [Pelagicoccus enzymogenes]MBD5779555.1 tetratricopeptide repeat protein [Pelagicoccus enzymogenes]